MAKKLPIVSARDHPTAIFPDNWKSAGCKKQALRLGYSYGVSWRVRAPKLPYLMNRIHPKKRWVSRFPMEIRS